MWSIVTRAMNWIRLSTLVALVVVALPQTTYAKDESSWVGQIQSRPSGPVGIWVVAGHSFSVTSATTLKEEAGPLNVGTCAEVKYTSGNGTDTATRIERQPDSICGNGGDNGGEQKVYARIQTIPQGNVGTWRIGDKNYGSTASTRLRQEHGSFAVGVCAEVEFTSANGTNSARSISTEDAYRCSNATFLNRARGVVQSLPSGLVGTWQIGGATYEATSSTHFQQRSPFAIGGCVNIAYFIQSGNTIATEIESEGADDCGGAVAPGLNDLRKLYAPIDTLPASPFVGPWRIGGINFVATGTTRFEQAATPFAAGACVEAKYVLEGSGNQLLAVESKPAGRCQIGGANAPRAYGSVDVLPTGLVGNWLIGGVPYQATASTNFQQNFGRFAVGAFVEVVYRLEGNSRVATKIETHVAPGAGQIRAIGTLESRPSDDTGTWVIGGVSYKGDDAIEVELEHQTSTTRAVSATSTLIIVNSYKASDGTLLATSITAARQNFVPIAQR